MATVWKVLSSIATPEQNQIKEVDLLFFEEVKQEKINLVLQN